MVVEIFFNDQVSTKNVPDVGIELRAACMPSGHASDRATALFVVSNNRLVFT